MMFMRPPQHGHGWVVWSFAVALSGACCFCAFCAGRTASISSRARAMVSALVPLRQQPAVPDAVETVRLKTWMRNRRMNSPGLSVHALVAAGSLDPDSLCSFERDAGRVGGDKAAAGDRDPVGVAGQIGEYLLRVRRMAFCYRTEPLGPMQRREIGCQSAFKFDPVSAFKFGSDSLLMKFKRRLVLVSQRNQYDAASPTSVGLGPSRV